MIRRGFWLTAGAVTGIYGYRRVSAVGRRLSARLNPASLNPASLNPASLNPARPGVSPSREARLARAARRGTLGLARETYRFTRDVREGMELYAARHSDPAGSTLGARDLTSHDPRPKDGH